MSDLYLVRHGQASFGTHDYDRLSAVGREQSVLLAEHFAALGRRVDALYSGPLRRQRDTARLIGGALAQTGGAAVEPVVLDELAEYDAEGLMSRYLTRRRAGDQLADLATSHGLDRAGYQQLLEATGSAWIDGELDDGGESWPQFRARVELGIDSIRRREGRQRTIMAAVSAGVIGAVLGHVLGLTHRQTLAASWVIHNCSVTLLRYDQRRLSLASFNAVGHLERPGRPDLLTYR